MNLNAKKAELPPMSEKSKTPAAHPPRIWVIADGEFRRLIANYGPWRSLHGDPLEYLSLQEAQERERLLLEALEQVSMYARINHNRPKDYGEVADAALAKHRGTNG